MSSHSPSSSDRRLGDKTGGRTAGKRIGLALSGGGFRATLYHLGLIRFLRDAGILQNVSHITSVSGGSIIAAHLALNWGQYTGSPEEFDRVAAEILAFTRLDVRNRILRRFPLGFAVRWPRRLLGLSNRKLTRTGLLEDYYQRHLYGDTSLFQLPQSPRLHILATNLSEGRLSSFNRDGLWLVRRDHADAFRIDRVHMGLATVPMAVTASSAFPGFFPPMTLTGEDAGASGGDFAREVFTDGGIFDNLGVRMFRFLAEFGETGERGYRWDGVLVSDVGKPFMVKSNARAGGLVRTAIRASDILSDRVWQLENETFGETSGFVFARITDVVELEEDPTALHPEIQRQLPFIRTDLDRFSPLEIRSLVQHGYCVARKACRSLPGVVGSDLPATPPWNPIPDTSGAPAKASSAEIGPHQQTQDTREARELHSSAARRIWSRMLDHRDWTSYIYVPLVLPILILLPYLGTKYYEHSHRLAHLVQSLAQGTQDLDQMSRLMESPGAPWIGEKPEELPLGAGPETAGFTIVQDQRIFDLREWRGPQKVGAESYLYGYRRMKVIRKSGNTSSDMFRVSAQATSPDTQIRFPRQQLKPRLYSRQLDGAGQGEKLVAWQVGVDFRNVPSNEMVDVLYESRSPGVFLRDDVGSTSFPRFVEAETLEYTIWILMPKGREYRSFEITRYETEGGPPEHVKPVTDYLAGDSTILAFKLLALQPGYTYVVTWFYR